MKVRLLDTNEVKDFPIRKALELIASGRATPVKENTTDQGAMEALNEARQRDGLKE
jgi:hypothetical protein